MRRCAALGTLTLPSGRRARPEALAAVPGASRCSPPGPCAPGPAITGDAVSSARAPTATAVTAKRARAARRRHRQRQSADDDGDDRGTDEVLGPMTVLMAIVRSVRSAQRAVEQVGVALVDQREDQRMLAGRGQQLQQLRVIDRVVAVIAAELCLRLDAAALDGEGGAEHWFVGFIAVDQDHKFTGPQRATSSNCRCCASTRGSAAAEAALGWSRCSPSGPCAPGPARTGVARTNRPANAATASAVRRVQCRQKLAFSWQQSK